ncbi:MAG TPA: response regulator [Planctomycetota bacterium]|jgi:two-component system chemotaxis sensor kinase CheA
MRKDPLKYFRIEVRELLDGLVQGSVAVRRGAGSAEQIARLLRHAHTLKGAARVVRQTEIADLAHKIEDVLAPYREGPGAAPSESAAELQRLIDSISTLVVTLEREQPAEARQRTDAVQQEAAGEEPLRTVRVEVADLDEVLGELVETGVQLGRLKQEVEHLDHVEVLADQITEQLASSEARPAARAASEELRSTLKRIRRQLAAKSERALQELEQAQERTHTLRLIPASTIFVSVERAALDTAAALSKPVQFFASGGEGRLEAQVLTGIREALQHLVRNCVAHGIETETERLAAGKPAKGTIRVHAERRGGGMVFTCSDDGRGIDLQAIRKAAVQSRLIAPADAQDLSFDVAIALLFGGGVSTAPALTEVSGRGVGLNAVRSIVQRLKGRASLKSSPGQGTTVEIVVPAVLSSLRVLSFSAAASAASLPFESIRQIIQVLPGSVLRSSDRQTIVVNGAMIPLIPLGTVLGVSDALGASPKARPAVIVQDGNKLTGLLVDQLRGISDVVARPLPALAGSLPLLSGVFLDREGKPQLILDPAAISGRSQNVVVAEPSREAARIAPVLLIDDSLTTRLLLQSILEGAGFAVDPAVSAEEGLAKARECAHSLFIVDVELPGMNGFQFIERTRAEGTLRETPSIIVTSLGSAEDRRRGAQAGARAYIVKSEFDQQKLLALIGSLIG